MRILLLIILLFVSLVSSAQFSNTHNQSSANTREVFLGGVKVNRGIINSIYADTATANANPIAAYHAGMIVVGDTLFLRNTAANKWIKVGSGSGSGGLSDGDYGDITVSGSGTVMTVDNGAITNAKLQNSSITVQGVPISLGSSGDIINGTGFVKASGTTISYDNSIYFSTASEGLTSSAGDVRLFGPLATPAQLTTERSINLRGNILHFNSRENQTTSGGPIWQHSDRPYSPYQFFSIDTLVANSIDPVTAAMPVSGIFARRTMYYNDGIFATQKIYGHYMGMTFDWKDSMRFRTEGGDYNQAVVAELRLKPRGTGVQRTGINGTGSNNLPYYSESALVGNVILQQTTGVNTIHTYGWLNAVKGYLVTGTLDTVERMSYFQTGSFLGGKVFKSYGMDFQHNLGVAQNADSSWGIWDQYGYMHYMRGNTVIGLGSAWATSDKLKVWGNVNISDSVNIGVANQMTDTLGVDIMLRRRTNGGVERIRADQLLSIFGGLPLLPTTGTGTATGNVIGNLSGNNLHIEQSGNVWLQLTTTTNGELAALRAYNLTDDDNYGEFSADINNLQALSTIKANFNDGAKESKIEVFADASSSTITHTADQHTFNGALIVNTNSQNTIDIESDAKQATYRVTDGAYDTQVRLRADSGEPEADFQLISTNGTKTVEILGNGETGGITHTADQHTINGNTDINVSTFRVDGSTYVNGLIHASDIAATVSLGDIGGALNSTRIIIDDGNQLIQYQANVRHDFDGPIRLIALAGNGAGVVAVDNDGDLSWTAAGSGSSLFPTTGTGTATGTVTGELSGNILRIEDGTDLLLLIDPTAGSEQIDFRAINATGSGNTGGINATITNTSSTTLLFSYFNGGAEEAEITAFTDNGNATLTYSSLFHLFNGSIRLATLAGNGAGVVAVDNDGDLSWTAAGSGTVTDVTWVGGIVSIATSTTTPAFTIAGTSGGIPYFSSTTTWASSGLLTSDAIVLGGGAGGAPTTLALGTANQVLGMNAAGTAHEYKTQQVGTAGTDVAIAHGVGTVTLNVPDASASNRGVITTGSQTIAGTKTFSGQVITNGLINSANYNISAGAGGAATSGTTAQILFAGAASVGYRAAFRGSTAYTMVANNAHGSVIIGEHAVTESGSGAHALIAQLVIKPLVVTGGSATTTDLATVYIEGPNTGVTPSAGTFSMWIDAGTTRLDGNVTIGGGTIAASATASLHLINGTIPSASITDGVVVYAEDVSSSSELKVRDEAGNITTLSPHNFTGIPGGRSESMAVAIYSERDGQYVNIDLVALARQVEKLTGKKIVYMGDTKKKPNPKNR